MQTQKLILGSPGTGKTTRLLNILEKEFDDGVDPKKVAFVSFTRKAAYEARDRAMDKFGFKKADLPYFRTLHSLCYQLTGAKNENILSRQDYRKLGELLGTTFSSRYSPEDGLPSGSHDGDRFLFLDSLARNRRVDLHEQWHEFAEDGVDWFTLKQFADALRLYKEDTGKLDFTDMLETYIEDGDPLDIDVAVIDEAQDLSRLQWHVATLALAGAKRIYIGGDDDQSIYTWSGADVEWFLGLQGEREVLNLSHRLPRRIFNLANQISARISKRFPKNWRPRDDEGTVTWHNELAGIDLSQGSWLLLARNSHLLPKLEEYVREQGMPYTKNDGSSIDPSHARAIFTWEQLRRGKTVSTESAQLVYDLLRGGIDIKRGFKQIEGTPEVNMSELRADHGLLAAGIWHEVLHGIPFEDREYYISILRSGEKLTAQPRIHISTIHAVKGGEAENVLLMTDMAAKSYKGYQEDPDTEHRVFYVGATRAKQNLHILSPQSRMYYDL